MAEEKIDLAETQIIVTPRKGKCEHFTIMKGQRELDPALYADWVIGAVIIKNHGGKFATFVDWSAQGVANGMSVDKDSCHTVWQSVPSINKPVANVAPSVSGALHIDPKTGDVTIIDGVVALNPDDNEQWEQALQVAVSVAATMGPDKALAAWHRWNEQGDPNGCYDSQYGCTAFLKALVHHLQGNRATDAVMPMDPTATEQPSSDTLLGRLETMREACKRSNWNDSALTLEAAIQALSPVAQPTSPAEAAVDTTMQLLQQGLLVPYQVLEILTASQVPGEGLQLGVDYLQDCFTGLQDLQLFVHQGNVRAGWWSDLTTGEPKARNDGELLLLIVSEVIEGFEGIRKMLMDDKLPTRKMIEVECADVLIRLLDYCGGRKLDLAGATRDKLAYNLLRADHKIENRRGENGKKF